MAIAPIHRLSPNPPQNAELIVIADALPKLLLAFLYVSAVIISCYAKLVLKYKYMVLVNTPKRTAPLHHKKRVGQHHKQTRRFEKAYWPYLPLVFIVVLGLAASSLWNTQQKGVLGYTVAVSPAQLLQSTNLARAASKEPTLALNAQLSAAAQAKAQDMVTKNYWSHTSPSGEQPWQFIEQSGYEYQAAGENLAYGYASGNATVTAWMNSAEHRANILNKNYEDVGFGIANATNFRGSGAETVIVAMYARPAVIAANSTGNHAAVLGAETPKTISRIQLLTGGNAPWSFLFVSMIAFACGFIVAVRHGLLWRRVLARGEVFVVRHHVLDVLLVSVGITGFILTRSVGGIVH